MHRAPASLARPQVFLCEQLLYSKAELDRHMRDGDETGPLAESGFKVLHAPAVGNFLEF
jgi:hypothetical protein